jgi:hypothetical protein
METGLKNISSIFQGERIFKIPQYQRAYAWEIKEWKEFFDDLLYHASKQNYFFGTLLLKQCDKDGDFEIVEVVDGQQRLTTMTIFLNLLIMQLSLKGSTRNTDLLKSRYIQTYERNKLKLVDHSESTFFETNILNPEIVAIIFHTPSQDRLSKAKTYFQERLMALELNKLEDFLNKIENAEVLVYIVQKTAEASLIFETTNDRGKSLTNLEKIKSFLMYNAYLSSENPSDLIDRIYDRFGTVYREIEQLKPSYDEYGLNIVSDDQIMQYHFIGYFQWYQKKDYQKYLQNLKDHINDLFKQGKIEELKLFVEDYSRDLSDCFTAFRKMLSQNYGDLREIIYLGRIAVLYPMLIKVYRKDVSVEKLKFRQLLRILKNFAFRVFALKFKRTNDVDLSLNLLCRESNFDIDDVINTLKSKIEEYAPLQNLQLRLRDRNFYQEYNYETKIYLLWRYENYLRTCFTPAYSPLSYDSLFILEERLKFSSEHIHAQEAKFELKSIEESDEFKEKYLHCIGNLVLDSKSANSSKGKLEWDSKQTDFFSNAPLKSQLELKSFVSNSHWDETAIQAREDKIIDFSISNFLN